MGTNAGIGGGMTNNTIRQHSFADDGDLQFVTTANTNFQNRAIAFTNNTFQTNQGFELTLTDVQTSSFGGASHLSFGLVSDDTDLAAYGGANSPFQTATEEAIGIRNDNGNFQYSDGTTTTTLASGTANTGTFDYSFSLLNDGAGGANWEFSIDGLSQGTGTIAMFDFTENYHVAVWGQDDQGVKQVGSITLRVIPEPSMSIFLALGILTFLMLFRPQRIIGESA